MNRTIAFVLAIGLFVGIGVSYRSLAGPEPSIETYLKETLKPATVEVVGDRIVITANFERMDLVYSKLFTREAGRKYDQKFTFRSGDMGIRLSNDGAAYVNCWFTDDVTCEIRYRQANRPFLERQVIAATFRNTKGEYLGNNSGTQLVRYGESGKLQTQGKVVPIVAKTAAVIKFVMKDETFTIYRDEQKQQTASYSKKTFATGQVGFVWGGGVSGNVMSLTISGRVDEKKLQEEMKKVADKTKKDQDPKTGAQGKKPGGETGGK